MLTHELVLADVQENAYQKAKEVYDRLITQGEAPPSVVVGADTGVP